MKELGAPTGLHLDWEANQVVQTVHSTDCLSGVLCGMSDPNALVLVAKPGELVTCPECRCIIRFCKRFSSDWKTPSLSVLA